MRSVFGWSLPPGCTHAMIEDQFADRPCAICGQWPDDCICPECPQCGEYGNPHCYEEHGLVRTEEQIKSLADREKAWDLDNYSMHMYACQQCLSDWLGIPYWELPPMSDLELECRADIALAASIWEDDQDSTA